MTIDVKGADDSHVAVLMGRVLTRLRVHFDTPDWEGLRQSHLRLLEHVPPGGVRLVDLARALRMTKQGAGQLVGTLTDLGLVETVSDPSDRRARPIVLTREGRALVERVDAEFDRLERAWAEEVGADEYAAFRRVLATLGGGLPD